MANIVITGAGQGLGQELVKRFDISGNNIILLGRDLKKLNLSASYLKFAKPIVYSLELSDSNIVGNIFSDITKKLGKINLLVNNAATWTGGTSIKDLDINELKRSMDLNFYSAFNCIKGVLDDVDDYDGIAVFNIGATASHRGGRNVSSFAIAKSSLRILTESLARELGPSGLHACHITIDGLIYNKRTVELNPNVPANSYLKMESIAKCIFDLFNQPKDCWTLQLDLRPYNESF